MDGLGGGDERGSGSVRYRGGGARWMAAVFGGLGVFMAVLFGLIVEDARRHHAGALAFVFGCGIVVVALLFGWLAALGMQGLKITSTSVQIPRALRPIHIPLAEIGGVGLVFHRTVPPVRMPSGWYLTVWRADGSSERTGMADLPIKFATEPGGSATAWRMSPDFDAVLSTDFDRLVATPAAIAALDIYRRVLDVQGPAGPLASLALQKHVPRERWSNSPATAYWSPDGETGYAAGNASGEHIGR